MSIFDEKIEKAKSICIVGHVNPDGDCIGAALSIYNYVLNKYKGDKRIQVYLSEFSDKYLVLPGANKISNVTNDAEIYDLAISVDVGSLERIKDYARYFSEAKDRIVFDHHEKNVLDVKDKIVDDHAIAVCELLYEYFDKKYVDRNVAICLYLGIATDSGIFRYKATSKKTFEIAGELIEYGFDFATLLDNIVFDNTVAQRKAQGIVFDRLKLICKGQVSYAYILDQEIETLRLSKNDIDNIIVYLREISGIKVAAFAYQSGHNIYKFSLRSKFDNINVAEFARMHDGGGHKFAAGCMYYGDIETIGEKFEKDMLEFIKDK